MSWGDEIRDIAESFCSTHDLPRPEFESEPGTNFWFVRIRFPGCTLSVNLDAHDHRFYVEKLTGEEATFVESLGLNFGGWRANWRAKRTLRRTVDVSSPDEVRRRFREILDLLAPFFLEP
jgi:hypothetical protein